MLTGIGPRGLGFSLQLQFPEYEFIKNPLAILLFSILYDKIRKGVIYLQHFIGNNKMLAGMKFVRQNLFGKKRLYLFLDITLQWSCTISRFIGIFHHFVFLLRR